MWVDLSDGRTIGVPYAWFPRLLNAISIVGLLAERSDREIPGEFGEAPGGRMKGGVGEVRRPAGFQIAKMYT
jgi:hypothetical protein